MKGSEKLSEMKGEDTVAIPDLFRQLPQYFNPILTAIDEQDESGITNYIQNSDLQSFLVRLTNRISGKTLDDYRHRTKVVQHLQSIVQLAVAQRRNMKLLYLILQFITKLAQECNSNDYQSVVDDNFLQLAEEGLCPTSLLVFQSFISRQMHTQANRRLLEARKQHDSSFYMVSFSEEEKIQELFTIASPAIWSPSSSFAQANSSSSTPTEGEMMINIPKKLDCLTIITSSSSPILKTKGGRRKGVLTSRSSMEEQLRRQVRINDTFQDVVFSNHRLVVECMLNLPAGQELRPTKATIQQMFARCVLRDRNFPLAKIMIECFENEDALCSPHHEDLRIGQEQYDQTFSQAVQDNNVEAIEFLFSQYAINPSVSLVDDLFTFLFNPENRQVNVTEMLGLGLGMLRATRRRRDTALVIMAKKQAVFELLQRHATSEAVRRAQEQEARRQRRLELQRRTRGDGHAILEIHQFSGTNVAGAAQEGDEEESSSSGARQPHKSLFDAINEHLESQVQSFESQHPDQVIEFRGADEDVISVMLELIEAEYPNNERAQADAVRKLRDGIDSRAIRILELTYKYLSYYHPVSCKSTWLMGFLGEAVQQQSCNPGVVERIITGLRGINDPALDQYFKIAEGPALARAFLSNGMNIIYSSESDPSYLSKLQRAERLVQDLMDKYPLCPTSTPAEVSQYLQRHMSAVIESYGVSLEGFRLSIEAVAEALMDAYEEFLLPHIQRNHVDRNNQMETC